MDIVIRPRADADLPGLATLLHGQQAETGYPHVWPPEASIDGFLRRPTELATWVAEDAGELVGHVAVTSVDDARLGRIWAEALGVGIDQLRCISVFFADIRRTGSGIGSRLFEVAGAYARSTGYPVLDVVTESAGAVEFYRRRGWRIVDTTDAPWDAGLQIHLMVAPFA